MVADIVDLDIIAFKIKRRAATTPEQRVIDDGGCLAVLDDEGCEHNSRHTAVFQRGGFQLRHGENLRAGAIDATGLVAANGAGVRREFGDVDAWDVTEPLLPLRDCESVVIDVGNSQAPNPPVAPPILGRRP